MYYMETPRLNFLSIFVLWLFVMAGPLMLFGKNQPVREYNNYVWTDKALSIVLLRVAYLHTLQDTNRDTRWSFGSAQFKAFLFSGLVMLMIAGLFSLARIDLWIGIMFILAKFISVLPSSV